MHYWLYPFDYTLGAHLHTGDRCSKSSHLPKADNPALFSDHRYNKPATLRKYVIICLTLPRQGEAAGVTKREPQAVFGGDGLPSSATCSSAYRTPPAAGISRPGEHNRPPRR
jgi:hypothetical protein